MGSLKISKDSSEVLVFNFDTSEIFNLGTELNSLNTKDKSVYCSTVDCYNCVEVNCNEVKCTQVQCNQVKCTQVKCSNCNYVKCSQCSADTYDNDCKD